MSRLERARWATGSERWPHLQRFLSESAPNIILGDASGVSGALKTVIAKVETSEQLKLASECWDFSIAFNERYDDWQFLQDGFGVSGKPPADDRGRGQTALSRMKLLYAVLAETIRAQRPDWKPKVGKAIVS